MDFWYKYRGPVDKLWPRRLLDTITMTSFERQDGNMYGGFRAPTYSIISYTWGRFAIENPSPNDPRLDVGGITWQIPAIDRKHFTVDSFSQMIRRTREISGNRFIWLDVACIDQENYIVKMEEVGRQAGIFANAGVGFAWLWKVPTNIIPTLWKNYESIRNLRADEAALDPEILKAVSESATALLGDSWFSSLWTLQEEGLRQEALPMSRDGEIAETGSDAIPFSLAFLHLHFNSLYVCIGRCLRELNSNNIAGIKVTIEETRHHIEHAGYAFISGDNPNISFTTAPRRQATNEPDRIYGVMSLYNIQVGAAVPGVGNSKRYTLDELKDEFAAALNKKSILLAQLFLHVERPQVGNTWKITQNARIPHGFEDWSTRHISFDDSVLDAQPGKQARIQAGIASFESLITYWKARILNLSQSQRNDQLLVAVDDYISREQATIPYYDPVNYDDRNMAEIFRHTESTVHGLLEAFESSRLSVLKLGGHSWRAGVFTEFFGLLVLHDEHDRSCCHRIGICRWDGDDYLQPDTRDIPEDARRLLPRFEEKYNGVIY